MVNPLLHSVPYTARLDKVLILILIIILKKFMSVTTISRYKIEPILAYVPKTSIKRIRV